MDSKVHWEIENYYWRCVKENNFREIKASEQWEFNKDVGSVEYTYEFFRALNPDEQGGIVAE